MLFTINKIWKSLGLLVGAWGTYAILGFEFTAITLLSLIIAQNFENSSKVV